MSSPDSRGDASPAPEQRTMTRRSMLGAGTAAIAALAGCTGENVGIVMGKRDESTETYRLAEGLLRIEADYGGFRVKPATDDRVRVRVEKSGSLRSSLSSVSVISERVDDTVMVRSATEGLDFLGRPEVDVEVELPDGVHLEAAEVDTGGLLVEDVRVDEQAELEVDTGGVVARRTTGDLHLSADNGGVLAEAVDGFVRAAAGNGGVGIHDCTGVLGASASNGGVEVDVTALRDDAELTTGNGGIEAALSPELDAHVVASTGRGGVDITDAPLTDAVVSGGYVEGTIGDGSHELRLETGNGGIELSGPRNWE